MNIDVVLFIEDSKCFLRVLPFTQDFVYCVFFYFPQDLTRVSYVLYYLRKCKKSVSVILFTQGVRILRFLLFIQHLCFLCVLLFTQNSSPCFFSVLLFTQDSRHMFLKYSAIYLRLIIFCFICIQDLTPLFLIYHTIYFKKLCLIWSNIYSRPLFLMCFNNNARLQTLVSFVFYY